MLDANKRQHPPFITRDLFMQFYTNTTYQFAFSENNVLIFHRVQSPAFQGNR